MGNSDCYSKVRDTFTTDNLLLKIFLAECLGTLVLIAFGDSSVAQSVLSRGVSGEFVSVNLAWGLGVSMGVWISGAVSGGHINPAVTLALCIMGRCPWIQLPIYWIGQYLGAFLGSAVVFGIYYQAIEDFDNGTRYIVGENGTAGIWATYPADYLTAYGGLGDQITGTAFLMMLVLAITDENNMKPPKGMVPFCVGLVVTVIGLTMGHNCGYAINPARDLSPRIFTAIAGWGVEVFTFRDYNWFWVPIVGPHIGAVLGGWMYVLFVGNHIRKPEPTEESLEQYELERVPTPDYNIDSIGSDHRSGVANAAYSHDGHKHTRTTTA